MRKIAAPEKITDPREILVNAVEKSLLDEEVGGVLISGAGGKGLRYFAREVMKKLQTRNHDRPLITQINVVEIKILPRLSVLDSLIWIIKSLSYDFYRFGENLHNEITANNRMHTTHKLSSTEETEFKEQVRVLKLAWRRTTEKVSLVEGATGSESRNMSFGGSTYAKFDKARKTDNKTEETRTLEAYTHLSATSTIRDIFAASDKILTIAKKVEGGKGPTCFIITLYLDKYNIDNITDLMLDLREICRDYGKRFTFLTVSDTNFYRRWMCRFLESQDALRSTFEAAFLIPPYSVEYLKAVYLEKLQERPGNIIPNEALLAALASGGSYPRLLTLLATRKERKAAEITLESHTRQGNDPANDEASHIRGFLKAEEVTHNNGSLEEYYGRIMFIYDYYHEKQKSSLRQEDFNETYFFNMESNGYKAWQDRNIGEPWPKLVFQFLNTFTTKVTTKDDTSSNGAWVRDMLQMEIKILKKEKDTLNSELTSLRDDNERLKSELANQRAGGKAPDRG